MASERVDFVWIENNESEGEMTLHTQEARISSIPILILTSSGENPDIQKNFELGANSYLVKPVSLGGVRGPGVPVLEGSQPTAGMTAAIND